MKLDVLTVVLSVMAIVLLLMVLLHGNDNDEDYGPF